MLTGQAKKDYQREYMRKRRAKAKGLTEQAGSNSHDIRPIVRPMFGAGQKIEDASVTKHDVWTGPLTKEKQTSRKGFNR